MARGRPRYRSDMPDELCFVSASWLAAALRTRDVSSVEIVDACLARIEQVNPSINAVVTLADDALERARDADAELAKGVVRGPLHGVPFTIKDSLDTAGVVTTAGTVGWPDPGATRACNLVARIQAARRVLLRQ